MTVIVTSKGIASRVKNIVSKRWDGTNGSNTPKHETRHKKQSDTGSAKKYKSTKNRKKKKQSSSSPVMSHLSSSLSSISSSTDSSSSQSSSPSHSLGADHRSISRSSFKRKKFVDDSSEYDDSNNGYSELDSCEDLSYDYSGKNSFYYSKSIGNVGSMRYLFIFLLGFVNRYAFVSNN